MTKTMVRKSAQKPSPQTIAYRKSLGRKIKLLRDIAGFTQAQFANALKYTEKFVSSVENGRKGMKMEKIKEAAAILHVHPDVLLTEKDLTYEQLEIFRNIWEAFQEQDNPLTPALLALSRQAAESVKK